MLLSLTCALAACGHEDDEADATVIPDDYAQRFAEVRDCRASADHGLVYVRIRVPEELADRYDSGPFPLPEGALIVKEQYDDPACRTLTGYTAMRKEAPGYHPDGHDFAWFTLDAAQDVVESGPLAHCASCHAACGSARDMQCAEP
jgi:hypothetical protein